MDYKYCCVVDQEGFLKDRCVLVLMELQPDGTVENKIQGYALLPGESLVDDKPPATKTNADSDGLIKPKRENSAWVEGATAEEIAAWEAEHPTPEHVISPPSQLDSIEAQATYTAMMTNTLLEG